MFASGCLPHQGGFTLPWRSSSRTHYQLHCHCRHEWGRSSSPDQPRCCKSHWFFGGSRVLIYLPCSLAAVVLLMWLWLSTSPRRIRHSSKSMALALNRHRFQLYCRFLVAQANQVIFCPQRTCFYCPPIKPLKYQFQAAVLILSIFMGYD